MKYAQNPFKVTDLSTSLRHSIEEVETAERQAKEAIEKARKENLANKIEALQISLPPDYPGPSNKNETPCPLLALPAELRALIIETAVTDPLGCGFTIQFRPSPINDFAAPHYPGQTRRRKALAAFRNLRATCRQLQDETDQIFFLQNTFDILRKTPLDETPGLDFFISRARNLTIQSKSVPRTSTSYTPRIVPHVVEVRLRLRENRWEAKCYPRRPCGPENANHWKIAEKIGFIAEEGLRLVLQNMGSSKRMTCEVLDELRTVLQIAEEDMDIEIINWRRQLWGKEKMN